jgi:hypothetical protein
MEQLAVLSNREYSEKIGDFQQWAIDARDGIQAMSSKVSLSFSLRHGDEFLIHLDCREKKLSSGITWADKSG